MGHRSCVACPAHGSANKSSSQQVPLTKGSDLWGSEEDDVEGLHHGRGEAQVPLLVQDVS